ncbi:MAG TPA: hypothetical protein VF111_14880, partial [Thermoanaerobaculia bacterium]
MSCARGEIVVAVLAAITMTAIGTGAAAATPCDEVRSIPRTMQLLLEDELNVPHDSVLSGGWRRVIPSSKSAILELRQGDHSQRSGFTLATLGPTGFSVVCSAIGTLREKDVLRYELTVLSSGLKIDLTGLPGAHLKIAVYTTGTLVKGSSPPADPARVGVPLNVYVLPGAPLASTIDAHVKEAVKIWDKAGVILQPKVIQIPQAKAVELLGAGAKLNLPLGCIQRFGDGFRGREALMKHKPDPNALAVFVGPSNGVAQAEPEFLQAYFTSDIFDAPPGRTLAHEIGHLLLGYG